MAVQTQFMANVGVDVRTEVLDGREFWVAPMVMATETVMDGSDGAYLYPEDEWKRNAETWNHKPIVAPHPKKGGEFVSACSPEVIEEYRVGLILNTVWDGKLKAEAWIDKEKARKVDPRIENSIKSRVKMEVSTGLYSEIEEKEGNFRGKKYKGIARNYQPDHLAILMDEVGACSIADGAGLLVNSQGSVTANQLSFSAIRGKIYNVLKSSKTKAGGSWYGYIEEIYDDHFIYTEGDSEKLFSQKYSVTKTDIKLSGSPVPVERVISYKESKVTTNSGARTMDKKAQIDSIIANNSVWGAEDRGFLEALPDNRIEQIYKNSIVANAATLQTQPQVIFLQQPTAQAAAQPTPAATPTQVTVEQYIANSPPEIRAVLVNGMNVLQQQKASLVGKIVANANNKFTKEYLETLEVPMLEGLAALAAPPVVEAAQQQPVPVFIGNAGVGVTANAKQDSDDDILTTPTMQW